MKNYISTGQKIDFIANSDVKSGDMLLIGSAQIFGISGASYFAGETGSADIEGVFMLPKDEAAAITQGAVAYFDNANDVVTETDTGKKIGFFQAGAAVGDKFVHVNIFRNV